MLGIYKTLHLNVCLMRVFYVYVFIEDSIRVFSPNMFVNFVIYIYILHR